MGIEGGDGGFGGWNEGGLASGRGGPGVAGSPFPAGPGRGIWRWARDLALVQEIKQTRLLPDLRRAARGALLTKSSWSGTRTRPGRREGRQRGAQRGG
ncbi:MAG: hypothetical protein ACK559_19700, partial [bacterium]